MVVQSYRAFTRNPRLLLLTPLTEFMETRLSVGEVPKRVDRQLGNLSQSCGKDRSHSH